MKANENASDAVRAALSTYEKLLDEACNYGGDDGKSNLPHVVEVGGMIRGGRVWFSHPATAQELEEVHKGGDPLPAFFDIDLIRTRDLDMSLNDGEPEETYRIFFRGNILWHRAWHAGGVYS